MEMPTRPFYFAIQCVYVYIYIVYTFKGLAHPRQCALCVRVCVICIEH